MDVRPIVPPRRSHVGAILPEHVIVHELQGVLCRSVASIAAPGIGFQTRKPLRSDQDHTDASFIRYVPLHGDVPSRRVVLAWRRSFTRYEAIAALRNEVYACRLVGVQRLT